MRRAWAALGGYLIAAGMAYAWVIRHPWRAPLVVPATAWDNAIALWPPAAYAYATYVLLLPCLLLSRGSHPGIARVLGAGVSAQVLNLILFYLLPTRIPWVHPAPSGTLLAFLQGLDAPLAAFPSGHVGLPMALAAAAGMEARRARGGGDAEAVRAWRRTGVLYLAWTVALSAAVLLTKQHVVLDAVGGLAFGGAVGLAYGPLASRAIARWRAWGLDLRSLGALGSECGAAALALIGAVAFDSLGLKALCLAVLATRQHALLVLYHDAVHGLLARSRRANDFLINACVGVPMGLPVHLYRALHLQHHRALGTDQDPERVLLYHGQPWRFRPLPAGKLLRQFLGDLLLWNNLLMVWRYFRLRSMPGALELPRTRAYPETAIQLLLFWTAVGAAGLAWPATVWPALALWLLTYATATQWLQKVRSFAEHTTADRDASLSGSWEPGPFGRFVLWPYRIHYHREHHASPHLPWHRLPEAPPMGTRLPGRALIHHLWRSA